MYSYVCMQSSNLQIQFSSLVLYDLFQGNWTNPKYLGSKSELLSKGPSTGLHRLYKGLGKGQPFMVHKGGLQERELQKTRLNGYYRIIDPRVAVPIGKPRNPAFLRYPGTSDRELRRFRSSSWLRAMQSLADRGTHTPR